MGQESNVRATGLRGRVAEKRDALDVVRGVQCRALMQQQFRRLARRSLEIVGSAEMFVAACVVVIAWAVRGPRCGFSDTWQLASSPSSFAPSRAPGPGWYGSRR
jgi:hypothetical protein